MASNHQNIRCLTKSAESLFYFYCFRSDNTEKEPKSNQETSEMHASIPPIVRNGNQFEYHNSWYIQSLNTTKVSEALPFRKIKVINYKLD